MSTNIGGRLAALEKQISQLQRAARLSHASLEDTALEVYDDSGSLRAVIGSQADGTAGVIAVNGPPPPQPTRPTIAPVLGGVAITWDGSFLGEGDVIAAPLDFARIEIHTGTTTEFLITPETLSATIESPQGGTLVIATPQPIWVRLMARNTSGTPGDPSPQAGPAGPAPVVAQDVLDGIIDETKLAEQAVGRVHLQIGAVGHNQLAVGTGNLIPDASFEGPLSSKLVDGNPLWSLTDGNASSRALRVTCVSETPQTRRLQLTELPVGPGDRLYCAFDTRTSTTWAGESVRLALRWTDSTGIPLGDGFVQALPTPGASWTRYNAQLQAPAGATTVAVSVEVSAGTNGTADFDNTEIRSVVAAGMVLAESIGTPELVAASVTGEKVAAKTLTAREVKALSLTGDEVASNTIVGRHVVAGQLTATHLAIGVDGNLVADPSFEGPATTGRLAAPWVQVAPGRDSPKAIRVDCTSASPTNKSHTLGTFPALPGQRVWLSADYQLSADWIGTTAGIHVRWEDASGAILGYSSIYGNTTGSWQNMSGIPTPAAPAQTVLGRIRLTADGSRAGSVTFDNATCRIVIGGRTTGSRAEISPLGLRLYDEEGGEAVSLITGAPNYLTLRNNGNPVATIDERGNAAFNDLAVAGSLSLAGTRIDTRLAESPRGLVAFSRQTSAVAGSSTELGYVELAFQADIARMYRIVLDAYVTASTEGGEVMITLRDGGTSSPTLTSPGIQNRVFPLAGAAWRPIRVELIRSGASFGGGLHRLLTTFRSQWAPAGASVTVFGRPECPAVLYVEDIGPALPETGVLNTGTGGTTTPRQQFTRIYDAAWSGSYANRSAYNSYYASQCLQGYVSSNNGLQAALIGFPASLGADLAGATIQKAELYLYYAHWYYSAGGKAVIKPHSHLSRPATFSSDSASRTIDWGRNVGKWIDITAGFDGASWRGVALDPANTSQDYYGRAEGVGEAHPPQLKVTYVK
ncbi:hypothetical protein [Streptomyces lavendulae]|uniref:hypothetical protein n=1 Tax=Streptomyces lavendulae TaxID=1914 RepID=UPI0036E3E84A